MISTLAGSAAVIQSKISNQAAAIKENRGFNDVLFGMLLAELTPVDSLEYYTLYEGELVDIKLRIARSGDIYVFVKDGRMWIYAGYYNNSERKYNFTDFSGRYHLIHRK